MPRKLPDRRPAFAPSTMPQAAQEAAQEVAHAVLSTTLDSVAQGTAMFDQDHSLIGWNGRLQQLHDLPDGVLSRGTDVQGFRRHSGRAGQLGQRCALVVRF
jgi:PAS domain-containing protein